jgi:hypothetical protein
MSKKNDKNTFGSEVVNRFAILTGDGKKKMAEENKKAEKNAKVEKYDKPKNQNNNAQKDNKDNKKNKKDKEDKEDIEDIEQTKNCGEVKNDLMSDIDKKLAELDKKEKNKNKGKEEEEETKYDVKERDETDGKNNYLNSQWTIWAHRNDCEDWTVSSYKHIYSVDSIGTFWEFFNNFQKIDKEDNQYFIMRNKIKPIWEDNNNRKGGICSLKMDCYDRNNKTDIGSEIMICLCILIMNETFIKENSEINGISYSVKNRSIYIKIWTKEYSNDIKAKLPQNLMTKFNNLIRSNMFKKYENNISVRYTPIKPEYDDGEVSK